MSEWKMPEWMRDICLLYGTMSFVREAETARSKYPIKPLDERERHLFSVTLDYEYLHGKGLLLSPTERDEQQKRIAELEQEVERLDKILRNVHPPIEFEDGWP